MSSRGTPPRLLSVDEARNDTQRSLHEILADNVALRARVGDLERENRRLSERVASTSEDLETALSACIDITTRFARIEAQSRQALEQQATMEQQNADLASLYVATQRLHATLQRDEVVGAIHEILVNLIGCEEFAIYDASPDGVVLSPVSWSGVDRDYVCALCLERGVVDDVASSGAAFMADELPRARGPRGELPISACIALTLEGRLTGIIVLFRMLGQKARLEPVDRELIGLLATHAASALYLSRAYAKDMPTRRPPPLAS
jgi:hypothetical protein